MKYVNQKEYPYWLYPTGFDLDSAGQERGKTTTISSSGCGLCSAVMVADRLIPNCEFGLKDAMEISVANNANRRKGTTYTRFAPAFCEKLGLDLEMTDDPERLRYCLRTGGVAVLHSKGDREGYQGVFSDGGHYVVAISEDRDGRIAVLDPSFKPEKYTRDDLRDLVEIKNNVIAVCDMQVVVDDTAPAEPSFYLFWRK